MTGARDGDTVTVLISSAGRRVALLRAFREAIASLGLRGRVLAADRSRLSSAFHASDGGHLVPACEGDEFVPAVLELCDREQVDLIVPTIDPELPVYARARQHFAEAGTTVAVSAADVVEIGSDKRATNAWLRSAGLPHVRQAPVSDLEAGRDGWTFPLLVKPRFGSSSKGVAVVHDRDQLVAATTDGDFVAETIAPGVEHTIDALVDRDGGLVCAVPRRRLEVRAGEVSKGVTVRSAPLGDLTRRAVAALPGAYGVLTIQAFLTPDDDVTVIEVNPRFGGGFPLSWQAGARFPQWMLEELLGLPSTASADTWTDRLVMLRYDDAVFVCADEVDGLG